MKTGERTEVPTGIQEVTGKLRGVDITEHPAIGNAPVMAIYGSRETGEEAKEGIDRINFKDPENRKNRREIQLPVFYLLISMPINKLNPAT